jgi:hypothetical protein
MRSWIPWVVIACLGCAPGPAPTSQVPLAEVPGETMAAAQKALPKVKLEHARKIVFRGEEVIEIRGKLPNGKIREAKVNASGKVVEIN